MSTDTELTTELATPPVKGVVMFDVTDTEIAKMQSDYLALSVNGVNDKGGLVIVHEARMRVKSTRVAVEKRRKELNAEALDWQRQVNAAAKEITSRLEPIEKHLEDQEATVEREKQRLKDEAAAKAKAIVDARLEQLTAVGAMANPATVAAMGDAAFSEYLATCTKAHEDKLAAEAEAKRIADEQAAKLAAERAELDRLRAEQADAQAKVDADNKRIKDEQDAERQRLADVERAAQEKIDEAQRVIDAEAKRVADAEAERVRAAELEQARIEAKAEVIAEHNIKAEAVSNSHRPVEAFHPMPLVTSDREKLLSVVEVVSQIDVPLVGKAASGARVRILKVLTEACAEITRIAGTVK